MNEDMKLRIILQLSLRNNKVFCKHSKDNVCNYCIKNISGDISRISGDISRISGDVYDIKKVLEEKKR